MTVYRESEQITTEIDEVKAVPGLLCRDKKLHTCLSLLNSHVYRMGWHAMSVSSTPSPASKTLLQAHHVLTFVCTGLLTFYSSEKLQSC